ncbi:MAG: hypothetical protein IJQ07_01445 [Clostridia bacterium]|nr:hypothetical protein [Clostridia bacterium]
MKKYFVILMLFILCIFCAVGFAACENENSTQNTPQDESPSFAQICGTYYLSLWTEEDIETGEEKVVMSTDEELGGEFISEDRVVFIFYADGTGEQWENSVKSNLRINWQIKDGKFYLYQDGSTSETIEVKFEDNKMLMYDIDMHNGVYQYIIFVKK